jgi:hypothetical protein
LGTPGFAARARAGGVVEEVGLLGDGGAAGDTGSRSDGVEKLGERAWC